MKRALRLAEKERGLHPVGDEASLRLAGIDFDEGAIRESLPRRFVDENVAAIRFGYELSDEEISHLASEAPPSRFQMNTAATAPDVRSIGGGLDASALPAETAETG